MSPATQAFPVSSRFGLSMCTCICVELGLEEYYHDRTKGSFSCLLRKLHSKYLALTSRFCVCTAPEGCPRADGVLKYSDEAKCQELRDWLNAHA